MLMSSLTVFDDYVYGTAAIFTSDEYIDAMGQYDQLAIQAVVDEPKNATAITVQIQHSADARNFGKKNTGAEIDGSLAGQDPGHGGILPAGNTTNLSGSDSSNAPSLAFVRLSIKLTGSPSPVSAHVRIYVTSREQGGGGGTGGLFMLGGAPVGAPVLKKIGG